MSDRFIELHWCVSMYGKSYALEAMRTSIGRELNAVAEGRLLRGMADTRWLGARS